MTTLSHCLPSVNEEKKNDLNYPSNKYTCENAERSLKQMWMNIFVTEKCFLECEFVYMLNDNVVVERKWIYSWSNISNMRRSVSSPDETPRRELKIRRAAEYFWRTSRCFIWWWNTVRIPLCALFSNKIILEGEVKDANTEQFFIRIPNTH